MENEVFKMDKVVDVMRKISYSIDMYFIIKDRKTIKVFPGDTPESEVNSFAEENNATVQFISIPKIPGVLGM